jgi:hypothetical protein
MGQESIDLRFGHFRWMPDMMKKNEAFDPLAIGLFGSTAVMARAQGFPQLIEELRFRAVGSTGRKGADRPPWRGTGPIGGYYFEGHSCSGHSSAPKTF